MSVGKYFDSPQNTLSLFEETGFEDVQIDVISYLTCMDDHRNHNDYKKQIIDYERNTMLEFIEMGLNIKNDILIDSEKNELIDLVNNRFDNRLYMVKKKEKKWDMNISSMVVITGRKPNMA